MKKEFIASYEASAAVSPYRVIKFSDHVNNNKIAHGAAATDRLLGSTGKLGGAIADMVDVVRGGIGQVQLGAAVDAGDRLTSDANGKAVKTTTQGDFYIGMADQPGVANDIIDYFVAPGVV